GGIRFTRDDPSIINVVDNAISDITEYEIHSTLHCITSIHKAEWHTHHHIGLVIKTESRFVLIIWVDHDLMITLFQIDLRDKVSGRETIKAVLHRLSGILLRDGNFVGTS